MSTHFPSLDGFLNHKGSISGGSKFLKGWKEKGKLYAWLHTLQLPIGLWRHNFPQLIVREEKDTRKVIRNIWGQSFNCHEVEETLLKQHFRDKNTGRREVFPEACPLCRMIEWVYQEVRAGRLSWTDAVFDFRGADDKREDITLHAGGLYNAYSDFGNKLTDAQKEEMKKAGIFSSEAWKENAKAALSYVFTLVDNDDVAKGVQITIEKKSLGDCVKSAINDALESKGVEQGNPQLNPYCIEFVFDDSKKMDKMYGARIIERIKLTNEIEELIRSEPPDLTQVIAPCNLKELRANMEKHAVIDMPMDLLFDVPAYHASDDAPPAPEETESDKRAIDRIKDHVAAMRTPEVNTRAPAKTDAEIEREAIQNEPPAAAPSGRKMRAPVPPPVEMGDPCDQCAAPMPKGALKCEACGIEYEADDEPAPPPPKQVAPPKAVAPPAVAAPEEKPCKACKTLFPAKQNICPNPDCGKKRTPF